MTAGGRAGAASEARIQRLREKLEANGLEAILVSNGHNRRYLSGFRGTAGFLLIGTRDAVLATDFRYTEQAALQAPAFRVEQIRAGFDWLPKLAAEMGAGRLGFEADAVTVSQHERFKAALESAGPDGAKIELLPTSGITAALRSIKDAGELDLITRAVEIGDEVFDEVSATLQPGVREAEIAWQIEQAMRTRGAEAVSFETIVGAGPNGARPHHLAADRTIEAGEPIVIDMGSRYRGYCSDLTRTVFLGEPGDEFKKVYDIVLTAQQTAIETVEAGMTGAQADRLARVVIEEAGYGEHFGHSLGHGVGLEVHEEPGVGPNSKAELRDGMVFTIEPGIYLPGRGGVRIEDVVVLEEGRARVISRARKVSP